MTSIKSPQAHARQFGPVVVWQVDHEYYIHQRMSPPMNSKSSCLVACGPSLGKKVIKGHTILLAALLFPGCHEATLDSKY